MPVEFEKSAISLDLPSEGVTLEDGWKLLQRFHPEVQYIYALYTWFRLISPAKDQFASFRLLNNNYIITIG